MNDRKVEYIADRGLDMLKMAVLLVLYERHLLAGDNGPHVSSDMPMRHIRQRIGLEPVGVSNDLVRGILNYLSEDGYVEESLRYALGRWQITKKGVKFIEGVE